MRDVRPPAAVAVGQLDRIAQQLGLALQPQVAQALDRQLAAVAALGVDELLEAVHRHLTEDRRDRVLEALGEQCQAGGGRGVLL